MKSKGRTSLLFFLALFWVVTCPHAHLHPHTIYTHNTPTCTHITCTCDMTPRPHPFATNLGFGLTAAAEHHGVAARIVGEFDAHGAIFDLV
jgi:hypothetical protein